MAKTKTELLTEAAGIIMEIESADVSVEATPGGGRWSLHTKNRANLLQERARQWLQEEISEEDGDSSLPQNEEPPTDDRWFAAYLKGIEAFGRINAGRGPQALSETSAMRPISAFAKAVADNALASARDQAKNSLANPGETK